MDDLARIFGGKSVWIMSNKDVIGRKIFISDITVLSFRLLKMFMTNPRPQQGSGIFLTKLFPAGNIYGISGFPGTRKLAETSRVYLM